MDETPPISTAGRISIAVAGGTTVQADTRLWSDYQKQVLLGRVEDAIERYRWNPKSPPPKPQVYVLAQRRAATPAVVEFSEPRKFALIRPR